MISDSAVALTVPSTFDGDVPVGVAGYRTASFRHGYLRGIIGVTTAIGLGSGAAYAGVEGTDEYDGICFTPTTVLAERIREGELSPVEVVEAFLTRIEERNDEINAFLNPPP